MKVSELVREIVELAEDKFIGETDHPLDCINVNMWCEVLDDGSVMEYEDVGDVVWQVSLSRPTQRQLDSGHVHAGLFHTVRTMEQEYRFLCQSNTLLDALYQLRDMVEQSEDYDW